MAERELKCLRCGTEMKFRKKTYLRLSDTGFFNLGEDVLLVEIYGCPGCGKLEFFRPAASLKKAQKAEELHELADDGVDTTAFYIPGVGEDVKCPRCGKLHPSDDPFCPLCGTRTVKPRTCKWCGRTLSAGEDKCPHCGAIQ